MRIGITDTMGSERKFEMYTEWLTRGNAKLTWKRLSYKSDNISVLEECDGLLLTGGGDVDPELYHGNIHHPKLYGIDRKRDDFERSAIDIALKKETPLLGICRGLQIANVHFGGTLFQDLPEKGCTIHEIKQTIEQRHDVIVEQGSFLSKIVGNLKGNVNSYHHQAIEEIGMGLRITARASDGTPEAAELNDGSAKPFFLLLQWHPERMSDAENPFSQKILHQFISAAERYSLKNVLNNANIELSSSATN